jgi:hypothetical protein
MANSIYNYALMKALYDEGQDYLDSFWPFAVMAIPSNASVDINYIQTKLKERHNLEMPLHVIGVLLARAEVKNYVRKERLEPIRYKLTGSGYTYAVKLENDREVERRITALLDSIKRFLGQKSVFLSCDQILEILLYFINKNLDFLVECINPSISSRIAIPPNLEGNDRYLLEYIQTADHQEPENYKILENMVMGSIISALLYVEEPEDITKIRTKKFGHCQVFLDTNFVFSILGLDVEEFNEPAKELLSLLKRNNFELKVFAFTVDEITSVLISYSRESYRYPKSMKINSLYSALKRKGWSKTDAREYIINIEHHLKENGIKIEWIKGIDLKNYKVDDVLRRSIKKYKPDQNAFSQNHDLAAIAKIQEIRGKSIRKIEDSEAFFLTSDVKLSRFNLETEHKATGTICETILDRLFTNILWLKNPSTKPPLKSIIAAHSRDLFVNRRVWDKFYSVLQELKKSGKVNDEGVSTLFWHNYVEDALRSIEESDVNKITPEFVLDKIETAGKKKEQDFEETRKQIEELEKAGKLKEEELEKKRKELELARRKLEVELELKEKSISDAKSQAEKEWLDKIQGIKDRIRGNSEHSAIMWSRILAFSAILVFVSSILIAYFHFNVRLQIISLSIAVIGGGGILGLWKYASKTRDWLSENIYAKRIKEAELDRI